MRSFILWSAALVLALAVVTNGLAGQGPGGGTKKDAPKAPPSQQTPEDGVPRVTIEQAHAALEKAEAIIVDVRSQDSYRIGHIKGALWMPDIASRIKELPRDKLIITYCS